MVKKIYVKEQEHKTAKNEIQTILSVLVENEKELHKATKYFSFLFSVLSSVLSSALHSELSCF